MARCLKRGMDAGAVEAAAAKVCQELAGDCAQGGVYEFFFAEPR